MGLLDVNVLVALAWDSHVHHQAAVTWFRGHRNQGWATCAMTEAGFVRVSSNAKALPHAVSVADARAVLGSLRSLGRHRHLTNDVSLVDVDLPRITGHRQVTDAVLVTVARRHGLPLVTFDSAVSALVPDGAVTVLTRT